MHQAYSTPRIARYLELLNQLKAGAGLDARAFNLSDDERVLSMTALRGEIYRMQTRRARYVLLRLDELLAKVPGATYDHKIISIEHVLPQNPKDPSKWRTDFTERFRVVV
ncbi:HNH endonuclease family protein [Nocardia sp. NBC_01377]|uniref:GmrSD restriction endonuclease domain-containing protein n=1 Tax=Nocardia sp. NBC_01377 TaxID=2903595 RepID=UPI00324B8A48